MANESFRSFLRRLARGMAAEGLRDQSDQELVARALSECDEAAFQAIVSRHGAMVYRVCHRTLAHQEDTEDAFQATFLVLARRLQNLRKRESLASWLHGIAHRVALRARTQIVTRKHREQAGAARPVAPADDTISADQLAALDRELVLLPKRWQQPLVLCYLEGRTQDEAAGQLGWSKSTLRRRLEEARAALASRLGRQGITSAGALTAILLSETQTTAAPTLVLISATTEGAVKLAAGNLLASCATARVAALTQGVLNTMIASKLTWGTPLVLLIGVLTVGMAWITAPAGQSQEPPPSGPKKTRAPLDPQRPWRAFGRVTDVEGKALADVQVTASCGAGSLHTTGKAVSDKNGRYEMDFGPGIWIVGGGGHQAATILAHKPGYFEANLSRQGNCTAADAMPTDEQLKAWNGAKDRVFLPGKPMELNFVMRPAGRVSGKVVNEKGEPLAKYSVSLMGPDLPPSSSVVCSTRTDEQGRFSLDDIPTAFRYQLAVTRANSQPPWQDSWASAALRFGRPERGDLRAWFGEREIRVSDFQLSVAGAGVHERTALAVVGKAGRLDLAAAPSEIVEQREALLSARSARLTLRNAAAETFSRSLTPRSHPIDPARPTSIRLARTQADAAGNFVVSFENPKNSDLEKGKHQAIFQLLSGASEKPKRKQILRQLDIRKGRYEVPINVPPAGISDCQVSVTFVSVQPDHDAWVKRQFVEGKGPGYSGIWLGDRVGIAEIPIVTKRKQD